MPTRPSASRPRLLGIAAALALAIAPASCRSGSRAEPRDTSVQQDDPAADRAMLESRWSDAVRLHREIVAREPDNGLALYHLGFSVGSLGDSREEAALYERALAAGFRGPDLLYNLGLARLALGDPTGARAALDEALAAQPDEAEFHHASARVALTAGDDARARRDLERAVQLDPAHREAWGALAELHERRGDAAAAAAARERAGPP